jgi:hypothetical protein
MSTFFGVRNLRVAALAGVAALASLTPALHADDGEADPDFGSGGLAVPLARLTAGGGVDSGWSGDGYFPLDLEEGTAISQILVQSDGRIVAVGSGASAAGYQVAALQGSRRPPQILCPVSRHFTR